MFVSAFSVLASVLSLAPLTSAAAPPWGSSVEHGSISQPEPGTHIAPGSQFAFTYRPHADYGISTFAYHVWLLDGAEGGIGSPVQSGLNGFYFGRFDYANYPGMLSPLFPSISDGETDDACSGAVRKESCACAPHYAGFLCLAWRVCDREVGERRANADYGY